MEQTVVSSREIKQASAAYPIHPLLQERWSPRAFADTPVEQAKLLSMLEAARWAPSGGNAQPWYFIVATKDDAEEYTRLASCLAPGNGEWATQAPVLILTVAQMVTSGGRKNGHAFHDVGLATQNLAIQATALGLHVHPMAGFSADTARTLYSIPDDYEPVTMLAVGYLGDPETLSEQRRQQELTPRVRRPLDEFVFSGTWGHASPIVK